MPPHAYNNYYWVWLHAVLFCGRLRQYSYTHQPSGCSLSTVLAPADAASLGSNIASGAFDGDAECDTDVPPDGRTDMESIMGLIIWPNELKS